MALAVIRRAELLKIFYALAKTLTEEDIVWLKKHCGFWRDIECKEGETRSPRLPFTSSEWEIDYLSNMVYISINIQDMVDAKMRRGPLPHSFAKGLPKEYLWRLVDIFGVKWEGEDLDRIKNLKRMPPKWEVANMILKKIS